MGKSVKFGIHDGERSAQFSSVIVERIERGIEVTAEWR